MKKRCTPMSIIRGVFFSLSFLATIPLGMYIISLILNWGDPDKHKIVFTLAYMLLHSKKVLAYTGMAILAIGGIALLLFLVIEAIDSFANNYEVR